MQYMVLSDQTGFKKTRDLKMVEFVRLKRENRLNVNKRRLPEKPPPEQTPPPPKMKFAQVNPLQADAPDIDMPNIDIPIQTDRFKGPIVSGLQVGLGQATGEVAALVRIAPRYPMRAAMKRIEGWVKVEFTITTQGTVKDVTVVEAHPQRIFNQEAIRAISKWKFRPKIVAGEPIERRAQQTLEFRLRNN